MPSSTLRPELLRWATTLVVVAFAFPAAAQQPVVEVDFRGRDALEADVIEGAIATHATSCRSALAAPLCLLGFDVARHHRFLDSAQVALDAERIATVYEIHGYAGTTVDYRIERDGDAARVVFTIREAPPFRVRRLELTGFPGSVASPTQLPLEVGDAYSLPALDASIERIEYLLARHGYPYASVTVEGSVDESARTADVVLVVEPGERARFGHVVVHADAPLRAAAIEDRLALEPGQPYDPLLLETTERRLYELEATGRAIVRVEGLRDSSSILPVVVEVSPRPLRGLETEATLSTTDCLEAAVFWTNRHLGGRPRVLRIGAAASNLLAGTTGGSFPCTDTGTGEFARVDYRAQASLDEPIAGTAQTWGRAELFAERSATPDVFVERGIGGALELSRRPNEDLGFALEYAPRRFELDAVELYLCGNYGACGRDAWSRLTRPAWLAPITATLVWMSDGELQGVTRDKLALWRLEPLPAFRAELRGAVEAAGAWSLSDFEYQRALVQASATRRFGETLELAARARGGALFGSAVLPPRVRLFSGGPASVRGVQQNLLGPALLVADPRDLDELGCAPEPGGCGAGIDVPPGMVRLRPLGGRRLAESALEARWSFTARAQAAAFLDFGWVQGDADAADDWIVSPGIGIRLIANIGAIRVDLAYDPRSPRSLPLYSAAATESGIVELGTVRYDPYGYDDPGFGRETWRRLQVHFAIGQAF